MRDGRADLGEALEGLGLGVLDGVATVELLLTFGVTRRLRERRVSLWLQLVAELLPVLRAQLAVPFAGAVDLNDERAIETGGVLFMEGEGEPAEIARIKGDLETAAARGEQTGSWLSAAMEAAWGVAEVLLAYPELADLLGERHRIIGNDWQAASMARLSARYLRRAVAGLGRVDFAPGALRADLADRRVAPSYLYSAAELIARAADISAASAVLVHEDERRWRVFRQRVEQITSPE